MNYRCVCIGGREGQFQMNEKALVGWEGTEDAELLSLNTQRGSLRKAMQELEL